MAKDNYTEITPEVVEELKEAEEYFEEGEEEMTEKKHVVRDFIGKHKNGLIAVGLTVAGFVLGRVAGSKASKKSGDSADDSLESDENIGLEQQNDQESVVESTATEVVE